MKTTAYLTKTMVEDILTSAEGWNVGNRLQ